VGRRSFLCKVRIERRIRSSPSAVPPSVPSCAFSLRPAEVSPVLSPFGDIDFRRLSSDAPLLESARQSKAGLDISRLSATKFPKPRIKRGIERASGLRRRDQGEEDAVARGSGVGLGLGGGERGEPMRGTIRLHSKGGNRHPARRRRRVCGSAMMRLFRPPLPSGSDVTSRCNKHEYK